MGPLGPNGLAILGAPPKEEFMQVWNECCKGLRASAGSDVGSRNRIWRMLWCISEVLKQRKAKFLRSDATVVSIFRDERAQRLLIRFHAVDGKFNIMKGVLGQAKEFGTGAENIVKATKSIAANALQPFYHPPRGVMNK